MKKDAWLSTLKEVSPAVMCKSFMQDAEFSKKMAAAKIDYNKCVSLVPEMYDKCAKKYYDQIPAKFAKGDGEKWGNNLGLCISAEFILKLTVNN